MGRTRIGIAVAGLVACGLSTLALAPTANANEGSYLLSLEKRRVYLSRDDALDLGYFYCNHLRVGRAYNAVYSDLTDYVNNYHLGSGYGTVGHIMSAAWNNLCPEFAELAQSTTLDYIPRGQRG